MFFLDSPMLLLVSAPLAFPTEGNAGGEASGVQRVGLCKGGLARASALALENEDGARTLLSLYAIAA
jgi:hypothetical protein